MTAIAPVLVWVLMTITSDDNRISYSPPVTELVDCQRMQQTWVDMATDTKRNGQQLFLKSKCVQVHMLPGVRP